MICEVCSALWICVMFDIIANMLTLFLVEDNVSLSCVLSTVEYTAGA